MNARNEVIDTIRKHLGDAAADEFAQKLDWKERILLWMLQRVPEGDKDVFCELFVASLEQAAMDSFRDAIYLTDAVAARAPNRVSLVLAQSMRELYKANWHKEAPSYSGGNDDTASK